MDSIRLLIALVCVFSISALLLVASLFSTNCFEVNIGGAESRMGLWRKCSKASSVSTEHCETRNDVLHFREYEGK